ncbi:phosphotransferase system, enzyme I, PtsI [Mariprofundus micogutta]|uniref:Phosphoenolpyruvate-protein phosphotransferase n=1 Tax=Mariprofundus micogutta TaxID=1921010 RepID=A0A1L8CNR0_9PROT|nr:phosphoenolpyruvate--protein phosphotransferase [Mariprofundus micogutta]GAV20479.1 phosphotransferase system, enzyme I, PtsI [Mariprofundus micogutta]
MSPKRFGQLPENRRDGKGVASSSGIVIGRVQKLLHGRQPIPEKYLKPEQLEAEVDRLLQAITAAKKEIDEERQHLSNIGTRDPMLILDVHCMLIADPELLKSASQRIRNECINAEWALRQEMDVIQTVFEQMKDEYLRNRKDDVEQAGRRILSHLLGQSKPEQGLQEQSADKEPVIYVGDDFSVSDIVHMWRHGVAAVVTEQGGVDAHNIIVARGIGLPALVGATGILNDIHDGEILILDAEQGLWVLNPSEIEQKAYRKFMEAILVSKRGLEAFACKPSLSKDGRELKLMANIEFPEELDVAESIGIDGIGLYRSEFLFINETTMPDETFQFEQYVMLVRRMQGKPVTMRLLDVGGDRPWLYRDLAGADYSGANPAMGLRGIRLMLRNPEPLKVQLRAMIRAAQEGPVNILVPMISCREEMEQVRELADQCRNQLGITELPPIGAMIEVPAAALIAEDLGKVSDFFSIGTNDLMQYTLASDRSDDEMAGLYQSGHAAILQLILLAASAAKKHGIPISVCGELAADPEWTATFLNLDMQYLSMSASNILTIRRYLSRQTYLPLIS